MSPLKGGGDRHKPTSAAAMAAAAPILDVHRARAAWAEMQLAGGLVSAADLRERWGTLGKPLTKRRVRRYTRMDGFPPPVEGRRGRTRWLAAEVDHWRRERLNRAVR